MGGVGDLSVVLGREVVLLGPPQAQPCQVVSPADSGGGARLSPEKAGGKSAGGCAPWTPDFYYRSFPLAGFCVGYVWTGRRAVTSGIPTPIWNAFSGKNMLKSIFVKDGQRNSPPPLHGAKAFPLGGRCPSAHTGADEGAIL